MYKSGNGIKFLIASISAFLLMAVTFLIMPCANYVEPSTSRIINIVTGTLFWLFLIAGIVLQILFSVWSKNTARVNRLSDKDIMQRKIGVISFFKNKFAMVFDILLIISAITLLLIIIFADTTKYYCYVALFILTFAFIMHCILNGKNFYILLNKG